MEGNELHRFLQKVLEAPINIARKILWLHGVEMPNDSKLEVSRHYPNVATPRAVELFEGIIGVDHRYTKELLSQLQNSEEPNYSEMIEAIKEIAFDTLEFVGLNALRLA